MMTMNNHHNSFILVNNDLAENQNHKIDVNSQDEKTSFHEIDLHVENGEIKPIEVNDSSIVTKRTKLKSFWSEVVYYSGCGGGENKKALQLSWVRDPVFLICALGNFCARVVQFNYSMIIPAFAMSVGVDKYNAALIMTAKFAGDVIGRTLGGWVSDFNFVRKKYIYLFGMTLAVSVLIGEYTYFQHIAKMTFSGNWQTF